MHTNIFIWKEAIRHDYTIVQLTTLTATHKHRHERDRMTEQESIKSQYIHCCDLLVTLDLDMFFLMIGQMTSMYITSSYTFLRHLSFLLRVNKRSTEGTNII